MNEFPHTDLSPAERVDDIPRTLRALREAVQQALRSHKRAGNPVAVWRDERVTWIQPQDIPLDPETRGGA